MPRSVVVDIQFAQGIADSGQYLPAKAHITRWVESCMAYLDVKTQAELSIRIVDMIEIQHLNEQFRDQPKPTNVLSFPYEALPGVDVPLLGDIVVCAEVVNDEARLQGKTPEQHWAHMVIHGLLHLCGYDHIEHTQAVKMESLEVKILATLHIPDPYTVAS